jgi:hypothetical protein
MIAQVCSMKNKRAVPAAAFNDDASRIVNTTLNSTPLIQKKYGAKTNTSAFPLNKLMTNARQENQCINKFWCVEGEILYSPT